MSLVVPAALPGLGAAPPSSAPRALRAPSAASSQAEGFGAASATAATAGGLATTASARRRRLRRTVARAGSATAALARPPVQKGEVSPAQPVPDHIVPPPYVAEPELVRGWWNSRVEKKDAEAVEAMRKVGRLASATLDLAGELIVPGRTTEEMDRALHEFMVENGAYPSDLQYKGFPKSAMISINEVICHGIPDSRELQNGDLVNVDVTLFMGGYHADTARTWVCGEGDADGVRLVEATRESLEAAIACCRDGAQFCTIGDAVSDIADREGFSVVRNLVGHGIGEFFHGVPQVFHSRNSDKRRMEEGVTFTIEPVMCEGAADWMTWDDGWTVATRDQGRTAQFEHTVLITKDGCEVLT